jgi:hypothetical protein
MPEPIGVSAARRLGGSAYWLISRHAARCGAGRGIAFLLENKPVYVIAAHTHYQKAAILPTRRNPDETGDGKIVSAVLRTLALSDSGSSPASRFKQSQASRHDR